MLVFVSDAKKDAAFAKRLHTALEQRNIAVSSALILHVPEGSSYRDAVEQASANADLFVFLLGHESDEDRQARTEMQALLWNDFDGRRPMMYILMNGRQPANLPGFLKRRKMSVDTDFDQAVDQIEYLLYNPEVGRAPKPTAEDRARHEKFLDDFQRHIEALKEEEMRHRGLAKSL